METDVFLMGVLSFISLLLISGFTYIIAKKYKLPYTVLLALVGIALIPLLKIPFFGFLDDFQLTPDILFYIFLPVLIFESGYNINYRQLTKNWKSIGILAVVGLLISAVIVGYGLQFLLGFIGWHVPLSVCFLFGTIISATDPVAVLALFKEVGAPRRLSLIFEGESLFNDGTALALFLVVLEIIKSGEMTSGTITNGVLMFLSMIIGGIAFGALAGYVFSLIIGKVKNMEVVEISLTMILAHLVFVLSEVISEHVAIGGFDLKISGVIATSIAAILMGNYGRYKISPKVEKYMEKFWSFFAFISNSLVFILMGLIFSHIKIDFATFIVPIVIVILVVIVARAISVYLPISLINVFKLEEPISRVRQKLLAWGSLRGGLALMMVFLIDDNFSIVGWNLPFTPKDFLLALTIGCIFFTLFIKAPTIGPMMRKLKITKLKPLEELEKYESEIKIFSTIINKIDSIYKRGYINDEEYQTLKGKYKSGLDQNIQNLKDFMASHQDNCKLVQQAVMLHALSIEKQALKLLYEYNEVNEDIFRYILTKIQRQTERVEKGLPQTRSEQERLIDSKKTSSFAKILKTFGMFNEESVFDSFIRYRAQAVISNKVVLGLQELLEIDFGYDKDVINQVINTYKGFNTLANDKLKKLYDGHKNSTYKLNTSFINKHLMLLEEKTVNELYEKELISPKLYHSFMDDIESEIYRTVNI